MLLLLLSACGSGASEPAGEETRGEGKVDVPTPSGPPVAQQADAVPSTAPVQAQRWESEAAERGAALRLVGPRGKPLMTIACRGRPAALLVTVPGFTPIGSEDRLSLGLDREPVTLVADLMHEGEGVTAEGQPPERARIENAEAVSAVYGSQRIGPVPAPPEPLRRMLAEACA